MYIPVGIFGCFGAFSDPPPLVSRDAYSYANIFRCDSISRFNPDLLLTH